MSGTSADAARVRRWARRSAGVLAGAPFAAFALAVVGVLALVGAAVALWPAHAGPVGRLAEQFRVWCLGRDPVTGQLEWAYVAMLFVHPALLATVVAVVWARPLRQAWRSARRVLWRSAAAGSLVAAALSSAALTWAATQAGAPSGSPDLPAARIRTAYPLPAFRLTDHRGQPFGSADLQGEVAVLTAVYASCPHTCPRILAQLHEVLAGLPDAVRQQVTVVAISLDPEQDTPERLATLARGHGLDAPQVHLLTGPPDDVGRVLDRLGIERRRDASTGVIDHANAYLVVDRQGRIAYRLGLGPVQRRWLDQALRLLVAEHGG